PLRGLVRHQPPGGVRAAAPRRHARRPDAVHGRSRDRAAVGGVDASARATAAPAPVRSRLVGAEGGGCADRAAPLVPPRRDVAPLERLPRSGPAVPAVAVALSCAGATFPPRGGMAAPIERGLERRLAQTLAARLAA